jgi:hypothetical protein
MHSNVLWRYANAGDYNGGMSTISPAINQVQVLARSIDRAGAQMSPEVARYFLDLQLSDADRRSLDAMAEKARQGALTPAEQADLDEYRRVGRLVELMKVKAQAALQG